VSIDWKEYKLGDIVKIRYGKDHKHLIKGKFPLFGSGGIMKYVNKALYDKESILIPRKGTLTNLFYSSEPFWSIDTIFYTEVDTEKVIPKFLYYNLKGINLADLNVGSAVPSLTTKVLNDILLNIPPLPEQKKIAEILSSLDDKIELNNKMNKNLEEMGQTLFKQWFVDFEFPNKDGKPYKSSGGKMIESELGLIPDGWGVEELGNVYKTTSGGTPSRAKKEFYLNGKIKWVKSKELNNSFILDTEEKINELGLKKSSAKLLSKYSVLIAMYGATVGELAILSSEASCNQAICAISKKEYMPYTYIFQYLKIMKDNILNLAIGSAQQNISQILIKKLKIIIPQKKIIQVYLKIVDDYFETILSNQKEVEILIETRNLLLPKLMSGKIRV